MYLAVVVGKIISSDKYSAYENRRLLLVQKLGLDRKPVARVTIAIDYVDAGEGDLVLVGAAPGLASAVFNIPNAPIRELVMGVIDRVDLPDNNIFGNSIPAR